jgi:hypothetical protein
MVGPDMEQQDPKSVERETHVRDGRSIGILQPVSDAIRADAGMKGTPREGAACLQRK